MWQCHIPSYDFELWTNEPRWLVNPNTGKHLSHMREHNRTFASYLQHPDVSFWEAVGHYEGETNRKMNWPRSLTRVCGCWKDLEEDHNDFFQATDLMLNYQISGATKDGFQSIPKFESMRLCSDWDSPPRSNTAT